MDIPLRCNDIRTTKLHRQLGCREICAAAAVCRSPLECFELPAMMQQMNRFCAVRGADDRDRRSSLGYQERHSPAGGPTPPPIPATGRRVHHHHPRVRQRRRGTCRSSRSTGPPPGKSRGLAQRGRGDTAALQFDGQLHLRLQTLGGQSSGEEYGEIEYGGLPVNPAVFVITLCCSAFQLWAACR